MNRYDVFVTAEGTVEVEAETEAEAKEAAKDVVFRNPHAWEYVEAGIL